jgi:hypothetical protein
MCTGFLLRRNDNTTTGCHADAGSIPLASADSQKRFLLRGNDNTTTGCYADVGSIPLASVGLTKEIPPASEWQYNYWRHADVGSIPLASVGLTKRIPPTSEWILKNFPPCCKYVPSLKHVSQLPLAPYRLALLPTSIGITRASIKDKLR